MVIFFNVAGLSKKRYRKCCLLGFSHTITEKKRKYHYSISLGENVLFRGMTTLL